MREQLASNAETLREIEQKMLQARVQPASWLYTIFYWLFVVGIVVGIGYLIKMFVDGKIKLPSKKAEAPAQ